MKHSDKATNQNLLSVGSRRQDRGALSTSPMPPAVRSIYWHRELPPLDAEAMDEHTVEATSGRVPGSIAHRDELWERCYQDLMAQARLRLEQEITRFGGSYAHVLSESTDSQHDGATGESWLHGRFTYMLYHRPANR
jgi:hypothetical protein